MRSENCFSGYCKEINKSCTGLDIPNAQWLEEMGEMIEAAVNRLRIEQSVSASCSRAMSEA